MNNRWWPHVTSSAAACLLLCCCCSPKGRAHGTNVSPTAAAADAAAVQCSSRLRVQCKRKGTVIIAADSVASAARLLAFVTFLNDKSTMFLKRVVPNGSRHTSRSHRPRYASVRLSLFSLTHPFFSPPPSLPPLLSAFDHHTDARPCSKEGLGFREARGAARYGALAVGVGLWYGCPTRIVVCRLILSTRRSSVSRPPRACSRALLSH